VIGFDPFSEAGFDDPFELYRRLRDEAPALYLEQYDCFFLSRFQDVWDAVCDPRFSHRLGTNSQDLLVGVRPHRALSSLVPPEHTALRGRLAPAFTPRAVRALEPPARAFARRLLDEADPERDLDVVSGLARRLSAQVAFLLIGLPQQDADAQAAQVEVAFDRERGVAGPTRAAFAAQERLRGYLAEQVEARRRRPGPGDLLDRLLGFEWEGRRLPTEELVANLYLLVIGGTETLPKVFAGAVHQLWLHPDQRALVAARPELADDAFWEALRTEMPTLMLGAIAEAPVELRGGTKLRPGQKVMHLWVSANHDEREFPDPLRFDLRRRAPRILSFNHARHRCLGAHVARMEGRVLLQELLARAPCYEAIPERAERIRSEFFRGFAALPVRLGPRP
jgi:cytochrome P450